MDQSKRIYKRRIHYIKKDFQFRFILRFCLLVLLGAVVSAGLLSFMAQGTLTSTFHNSRLVIRQTAVAILPAVIYTNLITLALITLATIGVTLYASHKLAGPMFRFESDLKVIGDGDLTKVVRLREGDQLKDLVDSINRMSGSLHRKVTEISAQADRLAQTARECRAPDALVDEIERLQHEIASRFTVDPDRLDR